MSDSDGSHRYPTMPKDLIQDDSEDPGPRRACRASRDVRGWLLLRV